MRAHRPVTVWVVSLALVIAALIVVLRGREPADTVSRAASSVVPAAATSDRGASPAMRGVAGEPRPAGATLHAMSADAPRKFERRVMFTCSGNPFFVRIGDGEVRLLPPGSLTGYYIPLARAGASTWRGRYANEDIEFRDGGDVGAVKLGAHSFDNCVATRDRASLVEANTGVTFQAFGHSPQWSFEIVVPEGFVLTTQRGEQHVVPFREPIDSGGKITFRSVLGTQEMVVVVDRIPCLDAPSGETLAHAVTVTFDNEWYYGCGRFIRYR
jgi:uncharacterized membrane protein